MSEWKPIDDDKYHRGPTGEIYKGHFYVQMLEELNTLAAERDALRAELAELTADRDSEERWANDYLAQAEALRAELAQAREAMKPFVRLMHSRYEKETDDRPVFGISDNVITVGDLRRARAALSGGA